VSAPPFIRTSERTAFRRCPKRWWWAYREGLRPKAKAADALWFGIGVHEALAEWYGEGFDRGPEPWLTFAEWVGEEIRYIKANLTERDREWFDEPVYIEAAELGTAMLRNYVREYGDDENLEVLAIEQPFAIDLVKDDEVVATFVSRFDGVAIDHDSGLFVLLEHKTAGSIKTAHLPLDDQAGAYFAVASVVLRDQGILRPDENIDAIMYNFLRKSMPDVRPRNEQGAYLNKNGSVSKRQPAPPFVRELVERTPREVNQQLRRITDEVVIMNMMRSGELPVTKSVTDMCPYCPFFTMCRMHERGGTAWMDFRDAEYTVADPYADQRKSAAE
jgi:PD-(D/E)XK nuclease superfamily